MTHDKKNEKAIVLLSGGMDSATCLAMAIALGYRAHALHLNYGQRTQERELKSFNALCDHYALQKEQRLIIDISHLRTIGGSALTNVNMPLKADGELSPKDQIPLSYVPFRNAHILSVAVSWAEVTKASAIFFGAVEEDSSGYPDCREEFIRVFNQAANLGTKPETALEIITPLLHLNKGEIVKKALNLKTPLELTWSCYQSEEIPCDLCDSCLLRKRGFARAGVADPVKTGYL